MTGVAELARKRRARKLTKQLGIQTQSSLVQQKNRLHKESQYVSTGETNILLMWLQLSNSTIVSVLLLDKSHKQRCFFDTTSRRGLEEKNTLQRTTYSKQIIARPSPNRHIQNESLKKS